MELFGIFILVFLAGVILVGLLFVHFRAKRRREALAALANGWGWTYRAGNDRALPTQFAGLKCLERGSNRYAYNVLTGSFRGYPACAFDYHYQTTSRDSKGRRRTQHHHSSIVVLDTGLPLKPLVIRPENIFDRMGEFFGFDDIDFESTEFSRAFHVWSPDRAWAFDVIHQETMEFLLAAPRYHFELLGSRTFVYRAKHFSPVEFQGALELAAGVIDRLPKYLLREWKGTF